MKVAIGTFLEYAGKRILFDTGNNPNILAQNAKATGPRVRRDYYVFMTAPVEIGWTAEEVPVSATCGTSIVPLR